MKSNRFFFPFALIIITIIVLSAFGRTLGSYFLEDDIGEVLYVHKIFSGDWHKLITNFTGNYMEIPTMKVYRPCLLLSIMSDYALWRTNATGYFLTNILFLIAGATILFMVLTELTRSWNKTRSVLFSLFSTALFASSPLHCESVSLMVGRVDIICAFFFLLSLWSFVRKGDAKNWLLTSLGIISFWIAILVKEMAIGLPVILPVVAFLFADLFLKKSKNAGLYTTEQVKPSFNQRINLALRISYPIWLSCILYFIIRYFALGTIFGGYIGSVGANQFSHILEKWTDLDTIQRIFLPFNKAVFSEHSVYRPALLVIYCALLALIFARIIVSGIPRRWLILLSIWILTALIPIYQLWGLGFNLEGSRFLFFLTIPLSMLLPLFIFAPPRLGNNEDIDTPISNISVTDFKILAPATCLFALLVLLNTAITAKNNIPWVHAGRQVQALLEQGQKIAVSLPPEQKAIVLGIPKDVDGAHVIYNGITFNCLMSPPFAGGNYASKFISFDPIFFGNANLINTTRFKQELNNPDTAACYIWQPDKMVFERLLLEEQKQTAQKSAPLELSLSSTKNLLLPFTWQRGSWQFSPEAIDITNCQKGAGIAIGPLNIDPFAYDLLEIEAKIDPPINAEHINVYWHDDSTNPENNKYAANGISSVPSKDNYQIYRIALSKYWRWFTNGQITKIWLEFPPAQSISIKNLRLLNNESLAPKISVVDSKTDNIGAFPTNDKGIDLQFDTSKLADCTHLKLQISKTNYFFDNFDSKNIDQALMTNINVDDISKPFFVSNTLLSNPGFYQIRVIALTKDGNLEGEWSDPITIKFGMP